ncbi:MAG: hypothetical protein WCE75_00650 [Terracidiphilus sp.]
MADSDNQANWHWAEGIKFALEGVKLLFILNGAASVSVLTFVGNLKIGPGPLVFALVAFALGAASVIPAMILAYLTQLHYGNASIGYPTGRGADPQIWDRAATLHNWAYLFMALSLLFFIVGVALAAWGLWHLPTLGPCSSLGQ